MSLLGKLIGVGVGPGAPDLLTMRAHRAITNAPVIAYPAPDDGKSFARSIVTEFIAPTQIEIPIIIPMRSERYPAVEVYDQAADDLRKHLDNNHDIAVLCEGDPFFYGSFMYLHDRLAGDYETEIIPGISSPLAASAVLNLPLVSRNDVLTILPAPGENDDLQRQILAADTTVIMKLGRHAPRIVSLLGEMGLIDRAYYAERVTIEGSQFTCRLAELGNREVPYFSMIIVQRNSSVQGARA
ncbi:MAG: precorrin-2 C(20)-methyltransferase [Pseudomonadota bacterium]